MRNMMSFARKSLLLLSGLAPYVAAQPATDQHYGMLPLSFEENRGQAEPSVRYISRTGAGELLLRTEDITLRAPGRDAITMRFVGSGNPAVHSAPLAGNRLAGTVQYLLGQPSAWIRDVPTFAEVRYPSVYRGIDAVFHGNDHQVEYDFILSPGSEPNQIRIAYDGAQALQLDRDGNLQVITSKGTLKQCKPKVWQDTGNGRVEIRGRYLIRSGNQVQFRLDPFDSHRQLIIDPVIAWSTYSGGPGDDRGNAVAVDASGAAYVAGTYTDSSNVKHGLVQKINPAGTDFVYTVLLGSNACNSAVKGIAVDPHGYAYVTGSYGVQDASNQCTLNYVLAAAVNATGTQPLYYEDFGAGDDSGNAIAIDAAGNAYITGNTKGGFPVTTGAVQTAGGYPGDAFVLKLNPSGAEVFGTYLGGSGADGGSAIALDRSGNIYVAGATNSADFAVTANAFQSAPKNASATSFVTKLNATLSAILYSTYLGGSDGDVVNGIAVDSKGMIYVAGATSSSDFPTTATAFDRTCGADAACDPTAAGNTPDGFVAKINPTASGNAALMYSSFLGGGGVDFAEAVALDAADHVFVAGRTNSNDFPVLEPTQAKLSGKYDAFVSEFDTSKAGKASVLFSTYLGGSDYDEATGITTDQAGDLYVTGYTSSDNFIVVSPVSNTNAGGSDVFVTKFANPLPNTLFSLVISPVAVMGGTTASGTVTISTPAGATGASIALKNDNAAVTVPIDTFVQPAHTSATFPIKTKSVTSVAHVALTATYDGITKTASLTLNPVPQLNSISLSPAGVAGGFSATLTVALSFPAPAGGANVTLSSSNKAVATVPGSIVIAAGSKTGTTTVASSSVSAATTVTITAAYAGVNRTANLVVNPGAAALTSVTFKPALVVWGTTATGTITLTAPAPAGTVVALATSDTVGSWSSVPGSVSFATGARTATFQVTTAEVYVAEAVSVTATYNGVSESATLTIDIPRVSTLVLSPSRLPAGQTTTGTVTLNGIAPSSTQVFLSSSSSFYAPVPSSVTVNAGSATTTFPISTPYVAAPVTVTVSASLPLYSNTATATLGIDLTNRGRKWVLNNVTFNDGGTASGYFTYDASTGTYLDVNITTTPGSDHTSPLGVTLSGYAYPGSTNLTQNTSNNLVAQNSMIDPYDPSRAELDDLTLVFARALTNAGGTIPLIVNPNASFTSGCTWVCTAPPSTISQEYFGIPPTQNTPPAHWYRVVATGSVTAQ